MPEHSNAGRFITAVSSPCAHFLSYLLPTQQAEDLLKRKPRSPPLSSGHAGCPSCRGFGWPCSPRNLQASVETADSGLLSGIRPLQSALSLREPCTAGGVWKGPRTTVLKEMAVAGVDMPEAALLGCPGRLCRGLSLVLLSAASPCSPADDWVFIRPGPLPSASRPPFLFSF